MDDVGAIIGFVIVVGICISIATVVAVLIGLDELGIL